MKKLYNMIKNITRCESPVNMPYCYPNVLTAQARDTLWTGSPWKAFQMRGEVKA